MGSLIACSPTPKHYREKLDIYAWSISSLEFQRKLIGMSKDQSKIRSEFLKYLSVGAVAYVLDVLVFNGLSLLRINGALEIGPYSAKIASVSVGMIFSYFANGSWTFRHRSGNPQGVGRFLKFVVVNLIGLALAVLPLYVSRELLGLDSLLADNVSANIVGAGLGFVFRFLANRQWVFTEGPATSKNT